MQQEQTFRNPREYLDEEIQRGGKFVAFFINQKGVPFCKGFHSPFLRDKKIKKMKYAGVKCTARMDY